MHFKQHFEALSAEERESLAQKAGTSQQMLSQIARGNKDVELGFAQVIVALCGGAIGLQDLPLTERAKTQITILYSAAQAA